MLKKTALLLILLFTAVISCSKTKVSEKPTTTSENWETLFNGKNLDGWLVKINGYALNDNYNNTFRVENEVLKVSYDQYENFTDEFGHLFYKTPCNNYRFRLQYRFVGNQVNGGQAWATKNSGIMIHCQAPESMLKKQAFPVSLEVQLLGGIKKGDQRPSGNLCTPGTHVTINNQLITDHCISATCKTYYGEEWITAEVLVNNGKIEHLIDGVSVISYGNPIIGGQFLNEASKEVQAKDGTALTGGYISLQSESHPIEFKNIEILAL